MTSSTYSIISKRMGTTSSRVRCSSREDGEASAVVTRVLVLSPQG